MEKPFEITETNDVFIMTPGGSQFQWDESGSVTSWWVGRWMGVDGLIEATLW